MILLVEDEAPFRSALSAFLRNKGYAVVVAADGREALDVLLGRHVDLAVIDLMLPKLNGKGLIATIRTDPDLAGLPVVVVTATSGETTEGELRPFVQAWMTKSTVTMADIERTIAGLITRPPPTLGGVPGPG